jgi:hypothetical protein
MTTSLHRVDELGPLVGTDLGPSGWAAKPSCVAQVVYRIYR